MAEGWCRHFFGDRVEVFSAGIERHGLNSNAVKAMREFGVDISRHSSNLLSEYEGLNFDLVVSVCSNAELSCPDFPAKSRRHVPFDDPPLLAALELDKRKELDPYLRVCLEIRDFVSHLDF